jgi:hypothetical protein
MARISRVEVFVADEVAVIHVMNRTVRRCFLLGDDPISGKNFDHRKQWMDEQLVHQARHFGIDLLCQALMSNHFHLVLRSRPDVVKKWDDTEVARRWLMLCPPRRDENWQPEEPTEEELNTIRKNKDRLAEIRSRLSDISWWMRLLSQQIAQRANREDEEVGKFWQARYRAVRLLDETAVLACAAYVDLNPIRAALAETIEDSEFTSAQKRVRDLQAKQAPKAKPASKDAAAVSESAPRCGGHLAPVELQERTGKPGPNVHKRGARCSNKGFLAMSTADYLSLLDWTARQTRKDKRGATPQHVAPLFDRLEITAEIWCRLVKDFGKLFSVVAGKLERIDEHRSRSGSHYYRTRRETRELLAKA